MKREREQERAQERAIIVDITITLSIIIVIIKWTLCAINTYYGHKMHSTKVQLHRWNINIFIDIMTTFSNGISKQKNKKKIKNYKTRWIYLPKHFFHLNGHSAQWTW